MASSTSKARRLLFRIAQPFLIFAVLCPLAVIAANYYVPQEPALSNTDRYERRAHFTFAYPFVVPYLLHVPDDYDPAREYPLVLILHGAKKHSPAAERLASWDIKTRYPAFVLMPIAPFKQPWALPEGPEFRSSRKQAVPLAMDILDKVRAQYSIDEDRIYITGTSTGGFGVFGALMRYPDVFAAAVSVCGGWPARDVHLIPKDVPVRLYHSKDDPQIPVKYSRDLARALNVRNGKAIYTEFSGVGHASWDPAYKDDALWAWLFAQRR